MLIETTADLARVIDHTTLRPEATEADVEQYCAEALEWCFAAVCVNPIYVPRVARRLAGSKVRTCSVVGFPLGAVPTALKRAEIEWAIAEGAGEIDMVISVGTLKGRGVDPIGEEVAALKLVCGDVCLKVIIEIGLLTDAEIHAVSQTVKAAGADFVKTSTGFLGSGATVDAVSLMRRSVGPDFGIKASGGIRTFADAMAMIEAGANRIGTSRGAAILREAKYHLIA